MNTGETIQRIWVERLYKEYEHLKFMYRFSLRPPLIEISSLGARWGLWDPLTRTLSLSLSLIQQYSWDIVLEIFKHEVAHQITSELYGSDESHGPLFQKACTRLGMAAWACRAETHFEDLKNLSDSMAPSGQEERLVSRIEKLLALATSSNEHEALLAMRKVQELYSKYQIERIESNRPARFTARTVSFRKKRIERYQYLACSLLNDHFFVRVIFTHLFDAEDLGEYRAFEMMGTHESVRMAEYVYYFLEQQVSSLWENYQTPEKRNRRSRNSFMLGVLAGFRDKLEKERKEQSPPAQAKEKNHTALQVVEDKQLENYVAYRCPRLHSVRHGSRLRDADCFDAGLEAGRKLILRRGIEEQQGYQQRLLR